MRTSDEVKKKGTIMKKWNKKQLIVIAITGLMGIIVFIGLISSIFNLGKDSKKNQETNAQLSVTPSIQEETSPTPIPTKVPTGPVIAIDPGHGGPNNSGTTRGELYEKDANLAISLFLKNILEERGYRTYMIREEDVTVISNTRSGLAKENGASLYVSIHLNSMDGNNNSIQGAEVWYCDLFDTQNDVLAQYIVDELTSLTGAKNRGIKLSNQFVVLKENTLPACLVE